MPDHRPWQDGADGTSAKRFFVLGLRPKGATREKAWGPGASFPSNSFRQVNSRPKSIAWFPK